MLNSEFLRGVARYLFLVYPEAHACMLLLLERPQTNATSLINGKKESNIKKVFPSVHPQRKCAMEQLASGGAAIDIP